MADTDEKDTPTKAPKAPKDPEPFPMAAEAPVPKGIPDDPAGRAAMMAAENAAALSTATIDPDEAEQRKRRAALYAKENSGIMVPEADMKATIKD